MTSARPASYPERRAGQPAGRPTPEDAPPAPADIETASEGYAARFAGPVGAWMLAVQERAVRALLPAPPGPELLDVGGGHAQLAAPLCRAGYRVTVAGSADACRLRLEPLIEAGRCSFLRADLLRLPVPDRSFDTALCFRLLPHCSDWPALVAELCRVSRRSVIVDYPTSQSVNRLAPLLFKAKQSVEGNTRPFRLFRHEEIEAAFARHGFEARRRTGQFVLPMALHRALRCRPLSAALERLACGLARRWGSPVILEARRREPPAVYTCRPPCAIAPGTRVLVTGATGFTGAVLTRKLADAGLEVHALARASSNREALRDVPVRWHTGEVYDPAVVEEAAAGVQYIFHVAAAYREARHGDAYYRQVHGVSTERLARAALRQPGFQRFVHVSTVGVHGHIAHPPADELAPMQPGDIYQRTKADAEIWLRDFARTHRLPFTVIRPAAIYGPGDRRLLKFFRMASRPVLFLLGRGPCLYHLVHVDDLTNVLILAATHPAALGEAFICGNPDCITLERMARVAAAELGRTPRTVRLPAAPFFLAADVCEWVCRRLSIEPPIHRRRLAFFTKDRSFDTRKLRDTLGYRTLHSNEEGIAQTARWYHAQGWL